MLRYGSDIDLDIIIPRSLCGQQGHVDDKLILQWNNELVTDVFSDVIVTDVADVADLSTGVAKLLLVQDEDDGPDKKNGDWVTRSIKCELYATGISSDNPVKVDLFPKYISNDGRIMWLGPEIISDGTAVRTVLYDDPLIRSNVAKFTDEELAAVVFLKLWNKMLQFQDNSIKSFHINIAVEKRSSMKYPEDVAESAKDPSVIAFNFTTVIGIMTSAIDTLIIMYMSGSIPEIQVRADDVEFCVSRLKHFKDQLAKL